MLRKHTNSLKGIFRGICVLYFAEGDRMTLHQFFSEHPRAAVAFSGGADSAYLLYAAKACGAEVRAYYVSSEFQPEFEERDARRLCRELDADLRVVPVELLSDPAVRPNPPQRCYLCKKRIFTALLAAAAADGFSLVLDGTNASDDPQGRPGMRALEELSVRSPLRECGLTKDEIRRLSKEAGLFTWDKPAYACLATRLPAGEEITLEKLLATQAAEDALFRLGFTDFRVRSQNAHARLQVRQEQLPLVLQYRQTILDHLKEYYKTVSLDLEVRT